jgi:hypothetical protein
MAAPKKSKMRFTEELRELYTEFRRTDFFDDLRAHAEKINRRINFLTIRKRKFCIVD